MCEFLVKAQADSTDPTTYTQGMPVVVMPDGHPWGNGETWPAYLIVKVPGVPVSSMAQYIKTQKDLIDDTKVTSIRAWSFNINALPSSVVSGTTTINPAQISNYLLQTSSVLALT